MLAGASNSPRASHCSRLIDGNSLGQRFCAWRLDGGRWFIPPILSQLRICLQTANNFLLSEDDTLLIFANLTQVIEQNWEPGCEEAELNEVDRNLLWRRQFLNPFSLI